MALDVADRSFDAAMSIFGVILFPDPVGGMREIGRVLQPGGRVAVVTWTEPQRYELAARLRPAIAAVRGPQTRTVRRSRHSSVLLIPPHSAHF